MKLRMFIGAERYSRADGTWRALGSWRQGKYTEVMSAPLYNNAADDYPGAVMGMLHPNFARLKPPGLESLATIEGIPDAISPRLAAVHEHLSISGQVHAAWIMATELTEFAWEASHTFYQQIPAVLEPLYQMTGVLPDPPTGNDPAARVKVTLTPSELWGDEWYKTTIPRLTMCEPDDRIIALIRED